MAEGAAPAGLTTHKLINAITRDSPKRAEVDFRVLITVSFLTFPQLAYCFCVCPFGRLHFECLPTKSLAPHHIVHHLSFREFV
jgi:hypothetical protein